MLLLLVHLLAYSPGKLTGVDPTTIIPILIIEQEVVKLGNFKVYVDLLIAVWPRSLDGDFLLCLTKNGTLDNTNTAITSNNTATFSVSSYLNLVVRAFFTATGPPFTISFSITPC